MDITIHSSFLPQDDPDAALAFYRDILGFEVRGDVEYGGDALDPYGVRDCAVRDPAGNLIHIQELR